MKINERRRRSYRSRWKEVLITLAKQIRDSLSVPTVINESALSKLPRHFQRSVIALSKLGKGTAADTVTITNNFVGSASVTTSRSLTTLRISVDMTRFLIEKRGKDNMLFLLLF